MIGPKVSSSTSISISTNSSLGFSFNSTLLKKLSPKENLNIPPLKYEFVYPAFHLNRLVQEQVESNQINFVLIFIIKFKMVI